MSQLKTSSRLKGLTTIGRIMKICQINFIRLISIVVFLSLLTTAEAQTVMQQLKSNEQTSYFAKALEDADLQERLNSEGPFTLFAPSNKMFSEFSAGQKVDRNLLLNHIFMGMATKRSLKAMSEVTCLSGKNITIASDKNQEVSINSFKVLTPNIRANNGVIHIIDGVIK